MMLGLRAIDPSTITVSSDPLAAFNAAQTSENNAAVAPPLPLCSDITTSAGFVGPINCDPSQGPVNYTPATKSNGTMTMALIIAGIAVFAILMREPE